MRIFWIPFFLLPAFSAYPQAPLDLFLSDSAISWAAISELKINLETEKVYAEQFIGADYNWVSSIKADVQRYPNLPPDKLLSHLLVTHLTNKQLQLYALETPEALDFPALRKQLISVDTVAYGDPVEIRIYRSQLPIERFFDYFILKQLWYYNRVSKTFHNLLLGIIPVNIHPDTVNGKAPVHQKLGWIPFPIAEAHPVDINDPRLVWIKKVTTYAYFSDWELVKGDTDQFVKAYFFDLPKQGLLQISLSGPEIPLSPPLTDEYIQNVLNAGKVCVVPEVYRTLGEVKQHIDQATPKEIKEVVGLMFGQYLYFDSQTLQIGSYLDVVGPLGYSYANDYNPEYPWENLVYCPIYFILNPANNNE